MLGKGVPNEKLKNEDLANIFKKGSKRYHG